jgi:ABC-2 type transport system ATP-binding protein
LGGQPPRHHARRAALHLREEPAGAGGVDELAAEIGRRSWAGAVARGSTGAIEITVADVAAAQREIPALVAARGLGLARMDAGEMGLEEVFVELVGGDRR